MKPNSSRNSFKINSNVIAILWMVSAGLFFSFMVGLVKWPGSRIPRYEIVFFRSGIQVLIITIIVCRIGLTSLKTNNPVLQGFRTFIGIVLVLPETMSLIGIVIIICSNLFLIFHEGRQ